VYIYYILVDPPGKDGKVQCDIFHEALVGLEPEGLLIGKDFSVQGYRNPFACVSDEDLEAAMLLTVKRIVWLGDMAFLGRQVVH
jgi:hypothetical protein